MLHRVGKPQMSPECVPPVLTRVLGSWKGAMKGFFPTSIQKGLSSDCFTLHCLIVSQSCFVPGLSCSYNHGFISFPDNLVQFSLEISNFVVDVGLTWWTCLAGCYRKLLTDI